ncbi:MAG: TetR/AcrR family transcriptional regulator [Bacillota bacterium]
MSRNSKKALVLTAAAKVVSERGVFNLTLDAVAKEAGISKGGLLYHYASKEKLVEDMVEFLAENYVEKIDRRAEEYTDETGRWTRAFWDVTAHNSNREMNAGLLAAKAVNPALMQPIRDAYQYWQGRLMNDGIDPVDATIVRLAADGIWLSQLLDLEQLDEDTLLKVQERLNELINRKR